jgi:DNA helicase-2/ATP-dependent DNA helicase PcrA
LYETVPSRFLSEIGSELIGTVAGRKTGVSPARSPAAAAAASPWRAGLAVYHDDYGEGVVIKVSPTPSSGPLVVVRFETGRQAQFFPKFTKKLEVSNDR